MFPFSPISFWKKLFIIAGGGVTVLVLGLSPRESALDRGERARNHLRRGVASANSAPRAPRNKDDLHQPWNGGKVRLQVSIEIEGFENIQPVPLNGEADVVLRVLSESPISNLKGHFRGLDGVEVIDAEDISGITLQPDDPLRVAARIRVADRARGYVAGDFSGNVDGQEMSVATAVEVEAEDAEERAAPKWNVLQATDSKAMAVTPQRVQVLPSTELKTE